MKKLYLIRHAKSSWEDITLDDFERPLNKRGEKDAPMMGKLLNKKNITADIIISSPSKRTKQTVKLITQQLQSTLKIIYNDNLYETTLDGLEKIIKNIDNRYESVYLFGHNPSLNSFVEKYINMDENIPTCGVVGIEFDCDSWKKLEPKVATKLFFEYPKLYR
jgi:phosphohistidine phosphatase